jgi:hypothetical protein
MMVASQIGFSLLDSDHFVEPERLFHFHGLGLIGMVFRLNVHFTVVDRGSMINILKALRMIPRVSPIPVFPN